MPKIAIVQCLEVVCHCEERQRRSNHVFKIASLPSVARNDDEPLPRAELLPKIRNKRKGFTLIETMIAIIVLAVCLTPFSILVVNVLQQNAYTQAQATSVALAEGEMERVTNLRFSSVANQVSTAFSAPFDNFSFQIAADYVNSGALNTAVAGPTDYKRVQVKVTNAILGVVTLTTLAANDW